MVTTDTISLMTKGFSDVIDITGKVENIVDKSGMQNGLVTVFCSGSTGAITTIEYESGVINDLKKAIEKIAPSKTICNMSNPFCNEVFMDNLRRTVFAANGW